MAAQPVGVVLGEALVGEPLAGEIGIGTAEEVAEMLDDHVRGGAGGQLRADGLMLSTFYKGDHDGGAPSQGGSVDSCGLWSGWVGHVIAAPTLPGGAVPTPEPQESSRCDPFTRWVMRDSYHPSG